MKSIYIFCVFFANLFFHNIGFSQGDDCTSALTLTNVTNYCSNSPVYANIGSTASGFAVASCWGATAAEDVWFSFTATGTDVLVSVNGVGFGGTMGRPRIAIYSGSCSGTIAQLACTNGTAGSGFSQLYKAGLILGQTYLIRISSTQANEGTFELCVNNYNPPVSASADCGGAGKLCNRSSISVGSLAGGGTNANEPSAEANSCMVGDIFSDAESNSVWYTWTCGVSGTLTFDLTPLDPLNDIDFVLYQLSSANPCGTRTIIRCNSSSCLNSTGSTGLNSSDTDTSEDPGCDPGENAYCQQVNMVAGTSYAILINNADGNSGFNMAWGGTGDFLGPDPNIVASDTTICAGESVVFDGSTSTNVSSLAWTFNASGSPVNISGAGPHTVVFPTTGIYVAILQATSASGCNSVEYKNIIVGSASTISVTSLSICPGASTVLTASGASSYTWSTGATTSTIIVSPSIATDYTVTGGVGTCTNTQIASVSINSVPAGVSAGNNQTLTCSSNSVSLTGSVSSPTNSTVNWSGANVCGTSTNLSTSVCAIGIYTLTATDPSNGCISSSTVQVFPNAGAPTVSISSTALVLDCINSSQSVTVTSTPNSDVTYVWNTPPATLSTDGSVATFTNANTYICTITDTVSTCSTPVQVVVSNNSSVPTTTASVSGTLTCITNAVTLNSTLPGMTYTWTAPTGGLLNNPNAQSTLVSGAAGIYTLTVLNLSNGCTFTTTATVLQNTVVPIGVSAGSNQTLTCLSNSVTLSGSVSSPTNTTANWTGINVCGAITSLTTSVCAPGMYTLTVTDPLNGCIDTSLVQVFPNAGAPVASISPSTVILTCVDLARTATVTVNSTNDISYSWSPAPASGSSLSIASFTNTGTYSCTVTNTVTSCSSLVQIVVSANTATPAVTTSSALIPCNSNSVALVAVPSPTNVAFAWTTSGGLILSGLNSATLVVGTAGQYVVTVTDNANGCTNTSTANVTSISVNAAIIANPLTGAAPLLVNFTNQSTGAASYSWNFGDNNNNVSTLSDPSHSYNLPGVYIVTLTATDASSQCAIPVTVTITVVENSVVVVPNVFTPNGDGSNDLFKITGSGIKELTCDIFNRWGIKLYTVKNMSDSWGGSGVEDGTYFFILQATGMDDKEFKQQGFISLFR